MRLTLFFQRGNTMFDRGNPLFEPGSGIPRQNAFAKCALSNDLNCLFELLVVPVDLVAQEVKLAVQGTFEFGFYRCKSLPEALEAGEACGFPAGPSAISDETE
jgi:hypothetical protein